MFLSHVPRIIQPKNQVPRPKSVPWTHTNVTTVGTLSGFQEFFLQTIIKDRPKKAFAIIFTILELPFGTFRGMLTCSLKIKTLLEMRKGYIFEEKTKSKTYTIFRYLHIDLQAGALNGMPAGEKGLNINTGPYEDPLKGQNLEKYFFFAR